MVGVMWALSEKSLHAQKRRTLVNDGRSVLSGVVVVNDPFDDLGCLSYNFPLSLKRALTD